MTKKALVCGAGGFIGGHLEIPHHVPRNADVKGSQLTLRNDSRVTRIGAFLRKTSIDELAQLFNVFTRDMSLVGRRPHPLSAKVGSKLYAEVVPNFDVRHCVLPGITGWAQVNAWRGETVLPHQIEQRVAHDFYYVANWSLWLDEQRVSQRSRVLRHKNKLESCLCTLPRPG
jgi:lipopolysaccharide/colanic/teichoic acid biosynthesis glycosyltransferase